MMTANYFMNKDRLDELDYFLKSLTREEEKRLMEDNGFLERFLRLLLKHNRFEIIMNILKEADNVSDPVFLQLWDEAHYGWHQQLTNRPLTPVQKFRIRLKFTPPPSICQDGVRPRNKMGADARRVLRSWFVEHIDKPYPSLTQRRNLSQQSGLTLKQVTVWFGNARRRLKRRKAVAKSGGRLHSHKKQVKGLGKDAAKQNVSAEHQREKKEEAHKKVAVLGSLCTELNETTNVSPTTVCNASASSVQTPRECFRNGIETGLNGSNTKLQTTTLKNHSNLSNAINQRGLMELQLSSYGCPTAVNTYEKGEDFQTYCMTNLENSLKVAKKRNENMLPVDTVRPVRLYEVIPVNLSINRMIKKTDHSNNTARGLIDHGDVVMTEMHDVSVSEMADRIRLVSERATSNESVDFSTTGKVNTTSCSQPQAKQTTDRKLYASTNRKLQRKLRSKPQKMGDERFPVAYSPYEGVETDASESLKCLVALCERVERETISPTDVAICMKLYNDSIVNKELRELQQYDSISKVGEFKNEEVEDSMVREEEEMEEDIDCAEVEVQTTGGIGGQFISMVRYGLTNGNNTALSPELALHDHRNLNDIPSNQPQYLGYQIEQRKVTPNNEMEHIDNVHRIDNISLIGSLSSIPHYRPEPFCNNVDDSDIRRIQIFDTSPAQQKITKEGGYSTVVGEAIQGLLNLSSSQEMDSSPPIAWSPQAGQGQHNLPVQQTNTCFKQPYEKEK